MHKPNMNAWEGLVLNVERDLFRQNSNGSLDKIEGKISFQIGTEVFETTTGFAPYDIEPGDKLYAFQHKSKWILQRNRV